MTAVSRQRVGTGTLLGFVALVALIGRPRVYGQEFQGSALTMPTGVTELIATNERLPDAPMPVSVTATSPRDSDRPTPGISQTRDAPKYAAAIEPGYQAQPLHAGQKIPLAGRKILSIRFPITVIVSAGISQALNSDPNYGTNKTAFAKRVGAAGARDASQTIFSQAILSPILHEDIRYYVRGSGHKFFGRLAYAATRGLIARTDGGRQTVNFAELGGYGGAAAMTQLYYPTGHRTRTIMLSGFGTSLGGHAIENVISEFVHFTVPGQPK